MKYVKYKTNKMDKEAYKIFKTSKELFGIEDSFTKTTLHRCVNFNNSDTVLRQVNDASRQLDLYKIYSKAYEKMSKIKNNIKWWNFIGKRKIYNRWLKILCLAAKYEGIIHGRKFTEIAKHNLREHHKINGGVNTKIKNTLKL